MELSILTSQEIEQIHQATLRVLDKTGIVLTEPRSRELMAAAGCRLDDKRVYIPGELVEDCIAKAQKTHTFQGRGGTTISPGDGALYFMNGGGCSNTYAAASRMRRPATTRDLQEAVRLLDAMDNCHTIVPFYSLTDVPGKLMALASFRHTLPHTTKPLKSPGIQNAAEVRYVVRMAEVIGDPAKMFCVMVSPVSPLTIPDDAAEAILEIAYHGIPFGPIPAPITGATAPYSLSGALVQLNAEFLACVVLAQLTHPGLPITMFGRISIMDPRSGLAVWGGVELGLASAGTVQLMHHYGFPVNVYGLVSNAHSLDFQNGYEVAMNALIPALAGADEISGFGMLDAATMGSLAQIVADNEVAGSIQRARWRFLVDQDALAVEVIASVMNGSHNYLGQKHTSRYLKSGEVLLANLAERGTFVAWDKAGRIGMIERAQAEAEHVLREHEVPPLEPAQQKELDVILAAAENELVG
ncbi:MAG: trimethylamine methyltransferase family protein [Anaerolineales bacterium]|nr:trimethylamine methyltransferase family protein [Anaerolineales bacterium]